MSSHTDINTLAALVLSIPVAIGSFISILFPRIRFLRIKISGKNRENYFYASFIGKVGLILVGVGVAMASYGQSLHPLVLCLIGAIFLLIDANSIRLQD